MSDTSITVIYHGMSLTVLYPCVVAFSKWREHSQANIIVSGLQIIRVGYRPFSEDNERITTDLLHIFQNKIYIFEILQDIQ
jgi:hypothetical protein